MSEIVKPGRIASFNRFSSNRPKPLVDITPKFDTSKVNHLPSMSPEYTGEPARWTNGRFADDCAHPPRPDVSLDIPILTNLFQLLLFRPSVHQTIIKQLVAVKLFQIFHFKCIRSEFSQKFKILIEKMGISKTKILKKFHNLKKKSSRNDPSLRYLQSALHLDLSRCQGRDSSSTVQLMSGRLLMIFLGQLLDNPLNGIFRLD